jgi:hypothetical protein
MSEKRIRRKLPNSVGFPKIEVQGEGTFKPPKPKVLTRECMVGDYVVSDTIGGSSYTGVLKEWDSNVAIIDLGNGSIKAVEC